MNILTIEIMVSLESPVSSSLELVKSILPKDDPYVTTVV